MNLPPTTLEEFKALMRAQIQINIHNIRDSLAHQDHIREQTIFYLGGIFTNLCTLAELGGKIEQPETLAQACQMACVSVGIPFEFFNKALFNGEAFRIKQDSLKNKSFAE